jgi:hypothetical protein
MGAAEGWHSLTPIDRRSWKGIAGKSRHLIVPELIHILESLCTTTTCSSRSRAMRGPRSHPRGSRAVQNTESELRRIPLPRNPLNRGKTKGRSGRLPNTRNTHARQHKRQKVGVASRVRTPPRFASVTLRWPRSVLAKSEPSGSLRQRPGPPRPTWTLGPCSTPGRLLPARKPVT